MKKNEDIIDLSAKRPLTKVMTFEKDGKVQQLSCEFIDLTSKTFDNLFNNTAIYQKKATVHARQVTQKEEVLTKLDATKNIAEPGDWIITNPGGESYRITDTIFKNGYTPKSIEEGIYLSKGIPVKVIRVFKNLFFKAPWGDDMAVQSGGFLIEREDTKERYAIEEEAFAKTYQIVDNGVVGIIGIFNSQ